MRSKRTPWNRSYKQPPVDTGENFEKNDEQSCVIDEREAEKSDVNDFARRIELDAELERQRDRDALKDPWE